MKPRGRDISCLKHIRDYCIEIENTVQRFGADEAIFLSDSVYRNAAALCILQIGELVGTLTDEYKIGHPEMPWKQIKAVRNIVAHSYGRVDAETLWEIIQKEIPELKNFCEKELITEENNGNNAGVRGD